MSMDFTTTLAGSDRAIGDVLSDVEKSLTVLGYTRSTGIVRADLDQARGVFDEVDEEVDGFERISEASSLLGEWSGASVEFLNRDMGSIYLLVSRRPGEYLNAWVDVGERWLRRLVRNDRASSFYAVLAAVANGCGAIAGVGDIEQAFQPRPPSLLIERIRQSTDASHRTNTQLFLIRVQGERYEALLAAWGPETNIRRLAGGYWVVETAEFREFWSK